MNVLRIWPDKFRHSTFKVLIIKRLSKVAGVMSKIEAELRNDSGNSGCKAELSPKRLKSKKPVNTAFDGLSYYFLSDFMLKSGERGIRTPGGFHLNGFQDRRIRPLCHLSGAKVIIELILPK